MKIYILLNDKFNDKNFVQEYIDCYFDKSEAYLILSQLQNAFPQSYFYIKEVEKK